MCAVCDSTNWHDANDDQSARMQFLLLEHGIRKLMHSLVVRCKWICCNSHGIFRLKQIRLYMPYTYVVRLPCKRLARRLMQILAVHFHSVGCFAAGITYWKKGLRSFARVKAAIISNEYTDRMQQSWARLSWKGAVIELVGIMYTIADTEN